MPRYRKTGLRWRPQADNPPRPWGREKDGALRFWVMSDCETLKRIHDFSYLESAFGERAETVAECIIRRICVHRDNGRREFVSDFGKFLAFARSTMQVHLPVDPETADELELQAWQRLLDNWQNVTHRENQPKPRTATQRLTKINQILLALAEDGLFPEDLVLPKGISNSHKRSRQRKNLIQQVAAISSAKASLPQLAASNTSFSTKDGDKAVLAQKRTAAEIRRLQVLVAEMASGMDPENLEGIEDALLAMAMNIDGQIPNSPEEFVTAMSKLGEHCINEIRRLSSEQFRKWQKTYALGTELIKKGDPKRAKRIANAINGDATDIHDLLVEFQKTGRENIPDALLCFKTHFGGLVPRHGPSKSNYFMNKLCVHIALRSELCAMVQPSIEAVHAAMLLLACESALNPSPIELISVPLGRQPAPDMPHHDVVAAIKRRARGRTVFSVLPRVSPDEHVSALEAMAAIEEAGAMLRKELIERTKAARAGLVAEAENRPSPLELHTASTAEEANSAAEVVPDTEGEDGGRLFVFQLADRVVAGTSVSMLRHLAYLLRNAGLSERFQFTPSAIRPCVLMLKGLTEKPDSAIIRTTTNHALESDATSHYEFDLVTRVRLGQYQREFQDLQVEFGINAPNSIDGEPGDADREELEELDAKRGGTIFVSLNEKLLLDALLTIACLTRARDRLSYERTTHWMNRCLREFAWAEVLKEKALKSRIANLIPKLEREVEQLLSEGFVHFLET